MITSWMDHGTMLNAQSYIYAVAPNKSADEMSKAATGIQTQVQCIVNTPTIQALSITAFQHASVVIWPSNTAAPSYSCKSADSSWSVNLISSQDGLYQFAENSTSFTLTASHPILFSVSLTVTVDRSSADSKCPSAGGKTTVSLILGNQTFLGQSVSITCLKSQTQLRNE